MTWLAVLVGSAVCFGLKLAGWLVPARALEDQRVRRLAALLPVGLLAGLVVVQVWGSGRALVLDAGRRGCSPERSRWRCGRRSWWWSSWQR